MRCSDVIDVIGITRRHVEGIPNVNRNLVKMRISENSDAKVLRKRFIFDTTWFESIREVYDVTSLQYLQHGSGDCCRQNDVTIISCIRKTRASHLIRSRHMAL